MRRCFVGLLVLFCASFVFADQPVASYLQQISVTIKANYAEGSGVIIKRGDTNYVLTAAHVIADLRQTRKVIDPTTGSERTVVDFNQAKIVQNVYSNNAKVGQLEMLAEVISYSNADHGEDLALLRILKSNFIDASADFYLGERVPAIGSDLYHVGSLKGEFGSNSLTTGIISQIGRTLNGKLYDQTSCTAFPGSSGGGVFLRENGLYVGMLVRSGGETFNLFVPMRRIMTWAERVGVAFVLDPSLDIPTQDQMKSIPIEDVGQT